MLWSHIMAHAIASCPTMRPSHRYSLKVVEEKKNFRFLKPKIFMKFH